MHSDVHAMHVCVCQERLVGLHNESATLATKLLSLQRLIMAANITNTSALRAVRCHSAAAHSKK